MAYQLHLNNLEVHTDNQKKRVGEWERNFVDDHCTNVLVWKLEMAAKESSIHPAMSIETVDNF